MTRVRITMHEQCSYDVDLDLESLGEKLAEPDLTVERLEYLTNDCYDSDFGIEGANELLDYMIESGVTVTDRNWGFYIEEED